MPAATFRLATEPDPADLVARLRGTWIRGGGAGLTYDLVDRAGRRVARVREAVEAVGTPAGSGFRRRFHVDGLVGRANLWIRAAVRGPDAAPGSLRIVPAGGRRMFWDVIARDDGTYECVGFPGPGDGGQRTCVATGLGVTYVELYPADGAPIETEIVTVVTTTMSDDVFQTIVEALAR